MFSLEPQFFDIFGAIGFVYIVVLSLFALSGKSLPKITLVILLLIGLAGFIVDVFVVYNFYLR